ncbi:hypothetical protein HO133_005347 [Letharia lupina]|uniref:Rhodopsin domain-containing protein n=1 Tax=Letharia lupina TaxID=560253 RepID=A0A8H6C8H7_9LECA|nr:uncharacterized protein HO133_005347 [Letharia lupina]KAF6218804.1 hypothetical protein HO133_005347 [Letharia lupina]
MDMANMPGMNGMATSTTSTSSTVAQMVMATAKAMSPAAMVPTAMSPTPATSTTMGGAAMASSILNNPQAGMATSMATMKDMCALPGMSQMCQDNTHIVIGTCIGLMILSTAAVLLRLASRRVSALSFWWDDAVIISSLMVSFTCSALMLVDAKNGVGRHFETVPESSVVLLFKTTVAYEILYCVCVTLIKISILLFYYRLFGVRKAFKYTCYALLALVTCWCIAIVFSNIFQCIPVEAAWIRPYPHSKCINNNASLLGTAVTNVFLDIVILVLPMVPVWSLSLTVRQKVTLTAIFLLGAFICGAAIVRVWAILNIDQTDVTWSYVRPLIWSAVEISTGITCACLPTLQPLIQTCLGRRSLSSPSRKYQPHLDIYNNNNNNHNSNKNAKYGPGLGYAVAVRAHGRPQMVGVRRPNANAEFYRLKERGPGVEEIVTSAWASREGSGRAGGGSRGPGAGWSVDEGPGTGWSEDVVPLKGIRVKDEVRVDTRSDSGGALSPV